MAFEFDKGIPIKTPETLQKKGLLRKAGEFLAPTTTGLLTGEKKPSLRTLGGAALEVGSFLIPAGAVARGVGIAGKAAVTGARGLRAAKVAQKTDILTELGRKTARLGVQAKEGARVGATGGALAGGGRALGEEDLSLTEVAGQAALGGVAGGIGGAVLAPAISVSAKGIGAGIGKARQIIKNTEQALKPSTREAAIRSKTEAYLNSFVEDKEVVSRRLDSLSVRSRRQKGPSNPEGLIREAVEEGYLPKVEGALANQRENIDDLVARRAELATKRIDPIVESVTKKTKLSVLKDKAQTSINENFGTDIDKASRQLDRIFESLESRYGKTLTAKQVNEIRKTMNEGSKAVQAEQFIFDTQYAIADATRDVLDDLAPAVRGINAEIGKLFRIEETLRNFHLRKIDVGPFVNAVGRYAGITAFAAPLGAVSGLVGTATGGSLFIAALAAQQGAKVLSSLVRRMRFNPQAVEIIRKGINRDQQLKNKLLREATGADRKLLEKVFSEKGILEDIGKRTRKATTPRKRPGLADSELDATGRAE